MTSRDHDVMDRLGREGRRAERVLALLESLRGVYDGGDVDELTHSLQVASRAERDGADEELVLAALCHDIGKVFGDAGHAGIAAALLAPHVRADVVEIVRHHGAFTARHWDRVPPGGVDPRERFREQPWFDAAVRFVDEWDMKSFDPTYDAPPLRISRRWWRGE